MGCNNLKTGGDSGSSSRDLCRRGCGGIYKDLYKVPRASLGQGGGFEHEGGGREENCLSDPHSQPPRFSSLEAEQPFLPLPKA